MNNEEPESKPPDATRQQLEAGVFFDSLQVSTALVTDTILDKVAH